MKKNETNWKMLAKHPIIDRKKRKSKKKFSSVKRALAKKCCKCDAPVDREVHCSEWATLPTPMPAGACL